MTKKSKNKTTGHPGRTIDQPHVLRLFRDQGKPLDVRDVLRHLDATKANRGQVLDILEHLADSGRLIRLRGAYGLAESMNLVTGVLEVQRSGVGYLLCDDKRRKDVFVNPRDFGEAWHGDRVAVALTRQRGKTQEGRVARVLERGCQVQPCRVERRLSGELFLCRPCDPRQRHAFLVEPSGGVSIAVGDVITAKAGDRLDIGIFSGEFLERLGDEADVAAQERLVKLNHDVPGPFPQDVLDQAAALPRVPGEDDFAGRQDLRGREFVTIDGETARDFDDAICVEKKGRGYLLLVAIADVSHYVPEHSPLDREAQARGNSFYFPKSVEPMFPETLSNGLCSLNPRVPRLAMVAEMEMSARGLPGTCRFYPAVIESKARLTYDRVNQAVLLGDEEARAEMAPVLPMLHLAEKLARIMKERRGERGSLDFDLPEPVVLFGPAGEAVDIKPRERHFIHQLIEEFMVAANEAVARFLTDAQVPLPYRVHPEPKPDKLAALFKLLGNTDLAPDLPTEPGAAGLRKLLARAEGSDLEFLVNRMTLRTMMQASYSVHNEGHYGLASPCYCHFTSPIRRYADLMVHRELKRVLTGQPVGLPAKRMQVVCEEISRRERVAMEAEREILKRLTVLFLRDKVGQDFTGVVNSLADFGFWVELTEVMAEGLVRLSTVTDDYYALIPERQELLGQRTGRRFALGQRVRVTLADVSLARLEVNLELAGEDASGASAARRTDRDRPGRDRKDRDRRGNKGRERTGKRGGPEREAPARRPDLAATPPTPAPAVGTGPDAAARGGAVFTDAPLPKRSARSRKRAARARRAAEAAAGALVEAALAEAGDALAVVRETPPALAPAAGSAPSQETAGPDAAPKARTSSSARRARRRKNAKAQAARDAQADSQTPASAPVEPAASPLAARSEGTAPVTAPKAAKARDAAPGAEGSAPEAGRTPARPGRSRRGRGTQKPADAHKAAADGEALSSAPTPLAAPAGVAAPTPPDTAAGSETPKTPDAPKAGGRKKAASKIGDTGSQAPDQGAPKASAKASAKGTDAAAAKDAGTVSATGAGDAPAATAGKAPAKRAKKPSVTDAGQASTKEDASAPAAKGAAKATAKPQASAGRARPKAKAAPEGDAPTALTVEAKPEGEPKAEKKRPAAARKPAAEKAKATEKTEKVKAAGKAEAAKTTRKGASAKKGEDGAPGDTTKKTADAQGAAQTVPAGAQDDLAPAAKKTARSRKKKDA